MSSRSPDQIFEAVTAFFDKHLKNHRSSPRPGRGQ